MKNSKLHWNTRYNNSDLSQWQSSWRMNFYEWAGQSISDSKCTVIDIGSGLGFGLKHLKDLNPSWEIYGLDYSDEACKKAVIPTKCIDILNEIIEEKFDYVLCIQTLEHFSSPDKVIKKLLSITKKKLIITVPYKEDISKHSEHEYSFSRRYFQRFNQRVVTSIQPEFKRMKVIFYVDKTDFNIMLRFKELWNVIKEFF
jgi:SAM-dependent methyltransferase